MLFINLCGLGWVREIINIGWVQLPACGADCLEEPRKEHK